MRGIRGCGADDRELSAGAAAEPPASPTASDKQNCKWRQKKKKRVHDQWLGLSSPTICGVKGSSVFLLF